ncbi:organic hydroperoxide resistance protein [Aeromonas salmonicida]|uniref:organic hydroperoxide resistance protein n=1 Tax=Aeromonas salmonicida TaxID=645 RepID=UPI00259F4959|nr:organic hydroperoxide resistance protein [Aeromonas salmonicida]MDM5101243.1 organic hydroperoxide resistance protein [Aeromonas salmonicida]
MKTLYRTQAIAQAGRNGEVHTLDNSLQLALALPTALGGNGKGNNPEQLLAAGYAACFSNALIHVAQKLGAPITSAPVTASVELLALADGRFSFAITLDVALAAAQPEQMALAAAQPEQMAQAEQLVRLAYQTCPFSNAMRGNVVTRLRLNDIELEKKQ